MYPESNMNCCLVLRVLHDLYCFSGHEEIRGQTYEELKSKVMEKNVSMMSSYLKNKVVEQRRPLEDFASIERQFVYSGRQTGAHTKEKVAQPPHNDMLPVPDYEIHDLDEQSTDDDTAAQEDTRNIQALTSKVT